MKKDIHPEYKTAKITCGCGNVLETKNTAGDLSVEICSACHPFFTGKQKLVDTAGRVDKFKARMETAEKLKKSKKDTKKSEPVKAEEVKKLDKKTRLRENATDGQVPETKEEVESAEELQKELEAETVDIKPTSDAATVEEAKEEKVQDKTVDEK